MRIAIATSLLLTPLLAAQTERPPEPAAPRVGSMLTPVPAEPRAAAQAPPQGPQCRVEMIPSTQEVQNAMDTGPLVWSVTWDPSVGNGIARANIQFALDEWAGIVQNTTDRVANPYPITIAFSDFGAGSGLIALTSVTYNVNTGNLLGATMSFNTRFTYYFDTTPADDSEFCPTCPPIPAVDLITVARHELGHAVGFTQTARINAWLSGSTFDAPRLNIGIDTTTGVGFHTSPSIHANDVMNPSIGNGVRRPISLYPSAAVVARAFDYEIPMRFIDPNAPGSLLTGSVNQPYTALGQATNAPILLFSPTTHHVPVNFVAAPPGLRNWSAARGGSLITAP